MRPWIVLPIVACLTLMGCETIQQAVNTLPPELRNRIPGKALQIASYADQTLFVAKRLSQYLSPAETTRTVQATVKVAETGQSEQFKTEKGATVTVAPAAAEPAKAVQSQPTDRRKPPAKSGQQQPSAQPQPSQPAVQTAAAEGECRTVRQTIVLANGTQEEENLTVCKGPDGWVARS